jgi:hypothetical protein
MRSVTRELGFALLAWLVPFLVSVCIFPLKQSHPPLFESLMGVALAGSTVALGCTYLRREASGSLVRGATVGLIWAAANWILDGLMFSGGPMKMTLGQYVSDIGVAYLMIPIITTGLVAATGAGARTVDHEPAPLSTVAAGPRRANPALVLPR